MSSYTDALLNALSQKLADRYRLARHCSLGRRWSVADSRVPKWGAVGTIYGRALAL